MMTSAIDSLLFRLAMAEQAAPPGQGSRASLADDVPLVKDDADNEEVFRQSANISANAHSPLPTIPSSITLPVEVIPPLSFPHYHRREPTDQAELEVVCCRVVETERFQAGKGFGREHVCSNMLDLLRLIRGHSCVQMIQCHSATAGTRPDTSPPLLFGRCQVILCWLAHY